jgi:nucleotide-binding universal stress UspA family protein
MSSVHRIMTGLEFYPDLYSGRVNWPAETEDLVRLSLELARVTHAGLAFAAVAQPPAEECDCHQIDAWMETAEHDVEKMRRSSSAGSFPIEQAAWFGNSGEEWAESARDSEMDLLIVPASWSSELSQVDVPDLQWPEVAGCPVWFAGREPDRLAGEPPLIVFCDDLSDEAAVQLPLAVELALEWNARLLIVYPLSQPPAELLPDDEDHLRREIFGRLSRTDFRALSHGSQLRFVNGGVQEILAEVSVEQSPNLVLASAGLVRGVRPHWRGHLLMWPR